MNHVVNCLVTCIIWCLLQLAVSDVLFGAQEAKGHVSSGSIDEASGLAISRVHPHVGYVHNDQGDSSRFFALDLLTGNKLATFMVTNAQNYDWEDIAIGPCVDDCATDGGTCSASVKPSRYCLYIGDIGDHSGDGAKNIVYMVREPTTLHTSDVDVVQTLEFRWHELNAETLMIHPDGRLFVISKVKWGQAKIAQLPASGWGHVTTLNDLDTATLRISTLHKDPQGGDIAPNGKEMLIVCEEAVYYYSVPSGDFVTTVRDDIPTKVSSYKVVPATEAISWTSDGSGFYIIPEGSHPYFHFYPKLQTPIVG